LGGRSFPTEPEKKMAKKSKLAKAEKRITDAAKAAAPGVKDVASGALGAAAKAAAGVVLSEFRRRLPRRKRRLKEQVPPNQPAGQRPTSKRRTIAKMDWPGSRPTIGKSGSERSSSQTILRRTFRGHGTCTRLIRCWWPFVAGHAARRSGYLQERVRPEPDGNNAPLQMRHAVFSTEACSLKRLTVGWG
jgi:hypothetical protein